MPGPVGHAEQFLLWQFFGDRVRILNHKRVDSTLTRIYLNETNFSLYFIRECVRNLVLRVQIFPKKVVFGAVALKTKDYIAVQRVSIGTDARFINFM